MLARHRTLKSRSDDPWAVLGPSAQYIDHILVDRKAVESGAIEPVRVKVFTENDINDVHLGADHYPVLAEFRFRGSV